MIAVWGISIDPFHSNLGPARLDPGHGGPLPGGPNDPGRQEGPDRDPPEAGRGRRLDPQFGPAIPIIEYRTVDEALTRANSLDVELGGSVWGNDPEEAAGLAARLACGTAWVNQHGGLHPLAPFGGVKCSGIGVEFNVDGLKEYPTIQVVNLTR